MRVPFRPRPRRRLALLVPVLAALISLPTAAAVRLGTPDAEILTGTHKADQLTGDAGNDTLRGLAGNDTYYFADGWGTDLLEEKRIYLVNGTKVPGGRDTLSFRGVKGGGVDVRLVPEWRGEGAVWSGASGLDGAWVALGASVVENALGTRSNDVLIGGGAANALTTGGGADDDLIDYGGWTAGALDHSGLPAGSDIFRGAAANLGSVDVADFGGDADVLDLRPLASDEVYLARFSCDGDAERECLQVVTGTSATSQVVVAGHFGAFSNYAADYGQRGLVETVLFADGPVSFGGATAGAAEAGAGTAGGGRDGEALLGAAATERQKQLAKRAPALAAAASLPPPRRS